VWQYELIGSKPVRSLEGIKGLRVRTFGYKSKAWAGLGDTPDAIPIPEIYGALQKGVIEAVLTQPISMYRSLHLCELAKNFTKVDLRCLPVPVVMNLNSWNSLTKKGSERNE
jgi:TRAP-type transport system periplasmic protein